MGQKSFKTGKIIMLFADFNETLHKKVFEVADYESELKEITK